MPFGFVNKEDKIQERNKVIIILNQLSIGRESAFVGAPALMKTKTLNEECVRIVLRFLNVEKAGCIEKLFGSFSTMVSRGSWMKRSRNIKRRLTLILMMR